MGYGYQLYNLTNNKKNEQGEEKHSQGQRHERG